jgi:hypothetical protein
LTRILRMKLHTTNNRERKGGAGGLNTIIVKGRRS